MFQRQLPSGKPPHPDEPPASRRQMVMTRPGKGDIIDLEPESPSQAPLNPGPSRVNGAQSNSTSRHSTIIPEEVFPAGFATRYEDYRQQQNPRPWGIHVNQDNPEQIFVTFYGSRWMLLLLFFANILIGFSLEKVPDFVPKIVDLLL